MSLVVFPFKEEDLDVIGSNLATAAAHPLVDEVWAVSARDGGDMDAVAALAERLPGSPVRVFSQDRIGRFRPGKGDGINTALRRADAAGFARVHLYDADITNFDRNWIEGAEKAADQGFSVVRHRFPRASTDAMITWMVTRPALAILFPGTILPRLGQPLGGEMLLTAEAVSRLVTDSLVTERSDWGIDTMLTYATTALNLPFHEHHVAEGKRHALYGSLDEIRMMVVECLDAVVSLKGRNRPAIELSADDSMPVPEDLKKVIGYDRERTIDLLTRGWTDEEASLAATLPKEAANGVLRNETEPSFEFMDARIWGDVLRHLLDRFELGDPAWESLAFRLWLMRVLNYSTNVASVGYDQAIAYLEATIHEYEALADQHGRPWVFG